MPGKINFTLAFPKTALLWTASLSSHSNSPPLSKLHRWHVANSASSINNSACLQTQKYCHCIESLSTTPLASSRNLHTLSGSFNCFAFYVCQFVVAFCFILLPTLMACLWLHSLPHNVEAECFGCLQSAKQKGFGSAIGYFAFAILNAYVY